MDNHFSAGGLIAERLKAELASPDVFVTATIAAALALAQRAPAVFVIPDIESVGGEDDSSWDGVAAFRDQRWLVVVAVRNVQEAALGQAALDEAGVTVTRVLRSLSGWPPSSEHGPLRPATASRLAYQAGWGWVPLGFETRIYTEGSING